MLQPMRTKLVRSRRQNCLERNTFKSTKDAGARERPDFFTVRGMYKSDDDSGKMGLALSVTILVESIGREHSFSSKDRVTLIQGWICYESQLPARY